MGYIASKLQNLHHKIIRPIFVFLYRLSLAPLVDINPSPGSLIIDFAELIWGIYLLPKVIRRTYVIFFPVCVLVQLSLTLIAFVFSLLISLVLILLTGLFWFIVFLIFVLDKLIEIW